eukprot:867223-Pelagomonas_calceolata.AAC.8
MSMHPAVHGQDQAVYSVQQRTEVCSTKDYVAHCQDQCNAHAHTHAQTHMRTHMQTHTYRHTYTHTHAHAHTRTHTCVHVRACAQGVPLPDAC